MPTSSQTPLFGRAWGLDVYFPDTGQTTTISSSAWEPEALRITFEVNLTGFGASYAFWFARIDIYNANPTLSNQLLKARAATVSLSAGYQTGARYGVIFAGTVYQTMFERVDVVDDKITLMCYTGLAETIGNFAVVPAKPQQSQYDLIQSMCAAANTPMTIGAIDTTVVSSLKTGQLARRRGFFGDPSKFIDEVASANQLVSWYGFDGLGISKVGAADGDPSITYDGATGQIIGTPQQTSDGLTMNVLLDPNLRVASPMQSIRLVNTNIRQLAYTPPGYAPLFSPDGTYCVNGLQHNGDTKGEDWKTEIVALVNSGSIAALIAGAGETPSSAQVMLDPRAPY